MPSNLPYPSSHFLHDVFSLLHFEQLFSPSTQVCAFTVVVIEKININSKMVNLSNFTDIFSNFSEKN